jgi:hypothetical protein
MVMRGASMRRTLGIWTPRKLDTRMVFGVYTISVSMAGVPLIAWDPQR